jgi:RHS repeat-associated protein
VHHKYTGQELDDSTGLYYYGARYYDPGIGRFISPDDATTDNYMYANNNPMTYVDPTGNFAQSFGGVSMFTNWDPRISGGGGFPNMGLVMPPSWSVPSGMNLGPMGPSTFTGIGFARTNVTVVDDPTLPAGMVLSDVTTTTRMVSGNELFASFVYPRYGPFFSAADITAMTWDRSPFWPDHLTETSGTISRGSGETPSERSQRMRAEAAFWGCALLPGVGCGADLGFQELSPVFGLGTQGDLKALSSGEIKKLQRNGIDPHDLKPGAGYDLFKDKQGNIIVKPKDGSGPGDPTGINIRDLPD